MGYPKNPIAIDAETLSALCEVATVGEIAKYFEIYPSSVYFWKKKFNIQTRFRKPRIKSPTTVRPAKIIKEKVVPLPAVETKRKGTIWDCFDEEFAAQQRQKERWKQQRMNR